MKHTKKRVAALLLTLAMVLSLMPAAFAADTDFPDMPAEEDASYAAVKSAVDNEIMTGENGMLNLEGHILRSTVSKMVVTAFAAKGEADLSDYPDVADGAWYAEWMAKANQMGIMSGTSGKMRPSDEVTLQEVATMLVRALGLEPGTEADLEGVPGAEDVAAWAIPFVAALVKANYISDVTGANQPMTRGAFAEVIYKVSGEGNYVKEAGEITEDVDGNIVITADGVSLKGITVKGDVIIADGVDAGSINLDGVKIEGRLVVRGGAEASLTNGTTASATIVAKTSGEVTVKADDSSNTGAIEVAGTNSKAPEKVTLDMAEPNATISTDTAVAVQNAKGGEVTMASANVSLTVESGTLDNVVVSDGMNEAKVEVAAGATIEKITTNTDLTVTGEGTVAAVTGSGVVSDESGEVIGGGDEEPADVPTVTGSTLPTVETDPNAPESTAHEHNWTATAENFDATRHTYECVNKDAVGTEGQDGYEPAITGCGEKRYENHSFGEDDTCTAAGCGAKKPGSKSETVTKAEGEDAAELCGPDNEEHKTHSWAALTGDAATAAGDKAASCTENGQTTYICSNCGGKKVETIAKLGHSYKATTTTAASCDEDGAINYECTTCASGATGHTKSEVIGATGNHTWKLDKTNSTAATCQATGTAHYVCTTCTGRTPASQDVTLDKDASAHDWSGDWTEGENGCEKTCGNSPCTEKQTKAHVSKNYTGSDTTKAYKAPTCKAVGQTAAVVCRDCGKVITASTEIAKTAHTAATAMASDASQHWTVCKDCDEVIGDKANHTWDKTNEDGSAATGAQCTVCGKKAGSTTPAEHTHSKGSTVKYDTTQHWFICDGGKTGCDGEKYDATNHNFGTGATSPNGKCTGCDQTHTCDTTNEGACSKCGYKAPDQSQSG